MDLPAPDKPVNQRMHCFWSFNDARAALSILSGCQWTLVARRSAKVIIPQPTVALSDAIDENETAHLAILSIRIEWDRPIERDIAKPDLIEIEVLGGDVFERIDVDFVFQLRHLAADESLCRWQEDTSGRAAWADRSSR